MPVVNCVRCKVASEWVLVEGGSAFFWCDSCLKELGVPVIKEEIDHPLHYGGADNPYEAVKVIESWKLGFNLGNTVKYISRAGKKDTNVLRDLKKAAWYLKRQIETLEAEEQK